MAKPKKSCKYCGSRTGTNTVCTTCATKLKLIRKIRAMLLAEKRRVQSLQGGETECTTSSKSNSE